VLVERRHGRDWGAVIVDHTAPSPLAPKPSEAATLARLVDLAAHFLPGRHTLELAAPIDR
jgi:hypothetical protein